MIKSCLLLVFLSTLFGSLEAFTSLQPSKTRSSHGALSMSTTEADQDVTAKGLLKRDRYVAMNRFAVRSGRQAKFEKRWATRKSRLASLDGFRHFHLMRRVTLNEDGTNTYSEGETDEEAQENYVSFTIWDKKSDFSAWRKGDAFKEAHGGTSIGAFISTMVNSAFVLRGPPRPAFYDGLVTTSVPPKELPETVDGWRAVKADGENTLPAECFVGLEKYYVLPEQAGAFEQFWANRESTLKDFDGFMAFSLLRRDGQAKGHGMGSSDGIGGTEPNYVGLVIFENRQMAESWAMTHGQESKAKAEASGEPAPAIPKMWNKDPEKVYYEGTLVIATEKGA